MALPHQVISIYLVPQEPRIWLVHKVRSNDKAINCSYSTWLKNRETDGGETEGAMVRARVGNARRMKLRELWYGQTRKCHGKSVLIVLFTKK